MDISPDTLDTMHKNSTRALRFVKSSGLVLAGIFVGVGGVILPPHISSAHAKGTPPEIASCRRDTFPTEMLRVIDGDTFEGRLDLGQGVFQVINVRLDGVDTPEVHGPLKNRDPVRGPAATEFAKNWFKLNHDQVEIVVHGNDKYGGRIDATVYPRGGGQNLSDALKQAGHAK